MDHLAFLPLPLVPGFLLVVASAVPCLLDMDEIGADSVVLALPLALVFAFACNQRFSYSV